jgi:PAS domain S-box-containing protein
MMNNTTDDTSTEFDEQKTLISLEIASANEFQKKYDVLLKTIPDGLILIQDYKIKYANESIANLVGYSVDEISSLNIKDIIAPNSMELVLERYEKRHEGEEVPTKYEIELIHKDKKTLIPVSVHIGVVSSGSEKLEFVIIEDLSKKQNTRSKFVQELQLQQYFMDYLPDSIYFKDMESRFIKANKATLTKMGLTSFDELLGKTDFDIFKDEHAIQAKKDEEEIIQNRTSIINKIEKETWIDGKITWAATTKIPLIDENDNVYGTFGITRDVTKLKKIEDVKDALLKISTAVTSLDSIHLVYAFIHRAISELMKADNFYIAIHHQDTDTISFPYFIDEMDEPPVERKIDNGLTEYVLRSGKAHLIDAKLDIELREKGETALIGEPTQIWLGVPLKVEGETIGAIVVQDYSDPTTYGEEEKEILTYVSEQIALAIDKKYKEEKILRYSEELKESNATKDKFFSIVAHDLKSPFHGLLGLTRLIVEEYDSMSESEVKSYLKAIKESTESTYKLIENLLEWSRLQSGRMEYKPTLQNMFTIVEDIRILLNQVAKLKNINIRNKLSHQSFIWGDDNMLQSLIQNLISNAIKFTPIGGSIEISENQFDDHIEYIVSDTGVGVKEADIEKLFRIDVSFTTIGTQKEKGTGLGLALCKEMVHKHGGKISLKSKVGVGTQIIFTLNKPKDYR